MGLAPNYPTSQLRSHLDLTAALCGSASLSMSWGSQDPLVWLWWEETDTWRNVLSPIRHIGSSLLVCVWAGGVLHRTHLEGWELWVLLSHLSFLIRYFPSYGKTGCCMCDFLFIQRPDMIKIPTHWSYMAKLSAPKITGPFIFSPLQSERAS